MDFEPQSSLIGTASGTKYFCKNILTFYIFPLIFSSKLYQNENK